MIHQLLINSFQSLFQHKISVKCFHEFADYIIEKNRVLHAVKKRYSHCENCDENIGLLIEYLTK